MVWRRRKHSQICRHCRAVVYIYKSPMLIHPSNKVNPNKNPTIITITDYQEIIMDKLHDEFISFVSTHEKFKHLSSSQCEDLWRKHLRGGMIKNLPGTISQLLQQLEQRRRGNYSTQFQSKPKPNQGWGNDDNQQCQSQIPRNGSQLPPPAVAHSPKPKPNQRWGNDDDQQLFQSQTPRNSSQLHPVAPSSSPSSPKSILVLRPSTRERDQNIERQRERELERKRISDKRRRDQIDKTFDSILKLQTF